jgi:hypothetical protein
MKGKSKSDDGLSQLPAQTLFERKTIFDDGFESFHLYSRLAGRNSDADGNSESEEGNESFHTCDLEI